MTSRKHGTSKSSHLRLIFKQSPSISRIKSPESIAKDFSKLDDITKEHVSYPSPYKNSMTNINAVNYNDKDDFKLPQGMSKNQIPIRKIIKKPKKTISNKKQTTLVKLLEDNFSQHDVNSEHLQMALALSLSSNQENVPIDVDIEKYPSRQNKSGNLRKTEKYGFTCNKSWVDNKNQMSSSYKERRKTRYKFITPILFLRTEEDRQNMISCKVSLITSKQILHNTEDTSENTFHLYSSMLQKYQTENIILKLNTLSLDKLNKQELFTTYNIAISQSTVKCGNLLRNWHEIPGRDLTPPRHCLVIDETNFNYQSKNSSNDTHEKISKNKCFRKQSFSPDLFDSYIEQSDEDVQFEPPIRNSIKKLSQHHGNDSLSNQYSSVADVRKICSLESSSKDKCYTDCYNLTQSYDGEADIIFSENNILNPHINNSRSEMCVKICKQDSEEIKHQQKLSFHMEFSSEGSSLITDVCKTKVKNRSENSIYKKTSNQAFEDPQNVIDLIETEDFSHQQTLHEGFMNKTQKCTNVSNILDKNEVFDIALCKETGRVTNNKLTTEEDINASKISLYNNDEIFDLSVWEEKHEITKEIFEENKSLNITEYMHKILNSSEIHFVENDENALKNSSFTRYLGTAGGNKLSNVQYKFQKQSSFRSDCSDHYSLSSDEELNYSNLYSNHIKKNSNISQESEYMLSKPVNSITNNVDLNKLYHDHLEINMLSPQSSNPKVTKQMNIVEDFVVVNDDSSSDICFHTPKHLSSRKTNESPKNDFIIKTSNITPVTNYDAMETSEIHKELKKYGIKPFKRKRGLKMLNYIYETTHPFVASSQNSNVCEKINGHIDKKRKSCNQQTMKMWCEPSCINNESVGNGKVNVTLEEKQTLKNASCAVPLHVVFKNLIDSKPKILESILLYEPLQLDVLHLMLKELGYKLHVKDLITFLDEQCITFCVNRKRGRNDTE